MMPAFAKPRRKDQLERVEALEEWAETCPYNRVERRGRRRGRRVRRLPSTSMWWRRCPTRRCSSWAAPGRCPPQALRDFAATWTRSTWSRRPPNTWPRACARWASRCPRSRARLPRDGELTPGLIRAAFGLEAPPHAPAPEDLPARPPALCPGCPHRLVFKELTRIKAIVTGDIGCYTLGALPPLSAMDTCVDMGASVSMAHGFELALAGTEHRPVVAVIGDSTFAHSGLSSLVSTVYNQGCGHGVRARQPHDGHDGPPGQPLQRRDAAEAAEPRAGLGRGRARARRGGRAHRRPDDARAVRRR